MKWKNKAHELDLMADKILEKKDKLKHIYIFGVGQMGFRCMLTLKKYGMLEGFIDNDIHKQQEGYMGYKVYSLEEYLKTQKNGIIVTAVGRKNISVIAQQLKDVQLLEGEDFYTYTMFSNVIFPILSVYLYDKVYISLAQICLTERCSLKCIKCAHGCFAVDNQKVNDLTLEQVYKSADSFFAKVAFCQEFVLIGGEPLLYKHLSDAIAYIGKHYRTQIGIFSITTNGTIMPDEELLKACKEWDVLFDISNYSRTVPRLKSNYEELTDLLSAQGIKFFIGKVNDEWMDYGFEYVNRDVEDEDLIKVFDDCKTPCREVRENRFYFCVMARSVSENMRFNVGKNDYLDLDILQGEQGKKELLEYNLGYSDKGYLDMCKYCHGAECENYPIPAAEQENRK